MGSKSSTPLITVPLTGNRCDYHTAINTTALEFPNGYYTIIKLPKGFMCYDPTKYIGFETAELELESGTCGDKFLGRVGSITYRLKREGFMDLYPYYWYQVSIYANEKEIYRYAGSCKIYLDGGIFQGRFLVLYEDCVAVVRHVIVVDLHNPADTKEFQVNWQNRFAHVFFIYANVLIFYGEHEYQLDLATGKTVKIKYKKHSMLRTGQFVSFVNNFGGYYFWNGLVRHSGSLFCEESNSCMLGLPFEPNVMGYYYLANGFNCRKECDVVLAEILPVDLIDIIKRYIPNFISTHIQTVPLDIHSFL